MVNEHMKRYSTSLIRMTIIKKLAIPSVGERVKKLEPSCIAGENVNWYSQYEKNLAVS